MLAFREYDDWLCTFLDDHNFRRLNLSRIVEHACSEGLREIETLNVAGFLPCLGPALRFGFRFRKGTRQHWNGERADEQYGSHRRRTSKRRIGSISSFSGSNHAG